MPTIFGIVRCISIPETHNFLHSFRNVTVNSHIENDPSSGTRFCTQKSNDEISIDLNIIKYLNHEIQFSLHNKTWFLT